MYNLPHGSGDKSLRGCGEEVRTAVDKIQFIPVSGKIPKNDIATYILYYRYLSEKKLV